MTRTTKEQLIEFAGDEPEERAAIAPWEERVKPAYPYFDPYKWNCFGTVETAMKAEIDELRAALAAKESP